MILNDIYIDKYGDDIMKDYFIRPVINFWILLHLFTGFSFGFIGLKL